MKSILVCKPHPLIAELVSAGAQLFDHSVDAATQTPRKLSETEKYLTILAAIKDPDARAGLADELLNHVKIGILTVGDSYTVMEFMALCSGMGTVLAETKRRDIFCLITSGTLRDWQYAVVAGCANHVDPAVRNAFNGIHTLFVNEGLGALWAKYDQQNAGDQTYLLEHRRGT